MADRDAQKQLKNMAVQQEEERHKLLKEKREAERARIRNELSADQIRESAMQESERNKEKFVPDFDEDDVPPLE